MSDEILWQLHIHLMNCDWPQNETKNAAVRLNNKVAIREMSPSRFPQMTLRYFPLLKSAKLGRNWVVERSTHFHEVSQLFLAFIKGCEDPDNDIECWQYVSVLATYDSFFSFFLSWVQSSVTSLLLTENHCFLNHWIFLVFEEPWKCNHNNICLVPGLTSVLCESFGNIVSI